MPCSKGDAVRSATIRTTYGGQKLKTPVKVKSICVEKPEKAKKQNKCPEDTVKRKSHERNFYKGEKLCRPVKVKGSCVKKPEKD